MNLETFWKTVRDEKPPKKRVLSRKYKESKLTAVFLLIEIIKRESVELKTFRKQKENGPVISIINRLDYKRDELRDLVYLYKLWCENPKAFYA